MVLICHRHEFIFLKTHKTASTSCEAALEHLCTEDPASHVPAHIGPTRRSSAGIIGARGGGRLAIKSLWWNHMPASRVALQLGPARWRRYRKIAVLRNPYDRAVSEYFQHLYFQNRDFAKQAPPEALIAGFRCWLPTADLTVNLNKIRLFGRVCIDRFFHFESLEADLKAFKAEIGDDTPLNLPHYKGQRRNRSIPYQAFHDDRTRAIVARANALELEMGAYAFEGDGAA